MTDARVALDVMGGDHAPEVALRGALAAANAPDAPLDPERILLVGPTERVASMLTELGGDPGFGHRSASEVIGMGESPAKALKAKPDNSIAGCVGAIRAGDAAAMVSMGNTGACVGAATLGLGTLEGVRRPGLAITLELTGKPMTMLDMGANVASKPDHLVQYGAMGAVYTRDCLGVAQPRVGLLNVGEEKGKGTTLLKEAYPGFEEADFDFIGNIEGGDLFRGVCDVVVTDGFTGNVILKLMESFSGFLLQMFLKQLTQHGADWGGEALTQVKRAIDYSTYGGALLLGVGGIVVVGHGRSDERAIANALQVAARGLDADVNRHIEQGLATAR